MYQIGEQKEDLVQDSLNFNKCVEYLEKIGQLVDRRGREWEHSQSSPQR